MIVRISWYKIPEIRVIDQRLYRQRFVLLHHFLPIFVSILFNPWHFRESRDTHFNEWPSVQLLLWLMSRRSQPWPWPVSGLGMHWTKPQILILHPVSANKKWEMSKPLRCKRQAQVITQRDKTGETRLYDLICDVLTFHVFFRELYQD